MLFKDVPHDGSCGLHCLFGGKCDDTALARADFCSFLGEHMEFFVYILLAFEGTPFPGAPPVSIDGRVIIDVD